MENYVKLLERGHKNIPQTDPKKDRFEIPKVLGHLQGSKTVVTNFITICNVIRRDPSHLLKYLQRELATPGHIDGPRLILGSKISASHINTKIERYITDFVLCPVCKKPDTTIIKEDRISILKCSACGAKNPIRTKI